MRQGRPWPSRTPSAALRSLLLLLPTTPPSSLPSFLSSVPAPAPWPPDSFEACTARPIAPADTRAVPRRATLRGGNELLVGTWPLWKEEIVRPELEAETIRVQSRVLHRVATKRGENATFVHLVSPQGKVSRQLVGKRVCDLCLRARKLMGL
eukprot:3259123-Prymnesium_polylepis.2